MHSWELTTRKVSLLFALALIMGIYGCADTHIEDEDFIDTKIIGGIFEANEPQAVAIRIQPRGICTGTVIAPRLVLTAAHCIQRKIYVTIDAL